MSTGRKKYCRGIHSLQIYLQIQFKISTEFYMNVEGSKLYKEEKRSTDG